MPLFVKLMEGKKRVKCARKECGKCLFCLRLLAALFVYRRVKIGNSVKYGHSAEVELNESFPDNTFSSRQLSRTAMLGNKNVKIPKN